MGDLKPCPFCGGEDIEDWGESTWSLPVKWMYCTCCNAHGPRVIRGRDEEHDAWMQRVRAEWDTRATPPEVTALVEALNVEHRLENCTIDLRGAGYSAAIRSSHAGLETLYATYPDGDMVMVDGPKITLVNLHILGPVAVAGIRAEAKAAAIARAELAEATLAIAEEALRGAIAAIDAAYDGPGDNGAYTVRERAALAKIEALTGGA